MSINIANERDFNQYVSLMVSTRDLTPRFSRFNAVQHSVLEIMAKKKMLAEFMAVRYLQDRLREYWQQSDELAFFYPLTRQNFSCIYPMHWVENALKNNEKVFIFDEKRIPQEVGQEIRRVGIFLTSMAEEYIERVIQFSQKTKRPPKIYLDYLKGKHDYPNYELACQAMIQWENNEVKQCVKNAKVKHVMNLPNGYYAVELVNRAALQLEGRKMANCLGDTLQPYLEDVKKEKPSLVVYSIRNRQGVPRVNVTVRAEEHVISDCAAKANQYIRPEDVPATAAFINALKLPMRTMAQHRARLLLSEGTYYDVFHLPKDKKFYDSCLDLEGLDLTELPNLENVVLSGSFMCAHNKLKNLKGAPKVIQEACSFYDNPIANLDGFPDRVGMVVTPIEIDQNLKNRIKGDITIIPSSTFLPVKSEVILAPYFIQNVND